VLSDAEAVGADDNEGLSSVLDMELAFALMIKDMPAVAISLLDSMLEISAETIVALSNSTEAEPESELVDATNIVVAGLEYGMSSELVPGGASVLLTVSEAGRLVDALSMSDADCPFVVAIILIVDESYALVVDEAGCDNMLENKLYHDALVSKVSSEATKSEGTVVAPFERVVIVCTVEEALDVPLGTSEEDSLFDCERSASEKVSTDGLIELVDSTDEVVAGKLLLGTDMLNDATLDIPLRISLDESGSVDELSGPAEDETEMLVVVKIDDVYSVEDSLDNPSLTVLDIPEMIELVMPTASKERDCWTVVDGMSLKITPEDSLRTGEVDIGVAKLLNVNDAEDRSVDIPVLESPVFDCAPTASVVVAVPDEAERKLSLDNVEIAGP